MKTEKLFELLTLVSGVTSRKWDTVLLIVSEISKGSVTIKSQKWHDEWKQSKPEYYPLDLSQINTWSTFDNTCIELKFLNNTQKDNGHPNNQLVCAVKIYDGDNMHGDRKQLRFEALLWLPTAFIHNIEHFITWSFDQYLEDAYESHLEAEKKLWILNLKKGILNT